MNKLTAVGSVVLVSLALAGCGGGGGGGTGPTDTGPPAPVSGTVSGTATKGPVIGATVTAYAISGGAMGARIASASTDAQGNFSLAMGGHSGPVMLQTTGGTFTDEASGTTMSMLSGDAMTAVLPAMVAGTTVSGIQLTPLTSMAQSLAQRLAGGMTDANIGTANSTVGSYFMVSDILRTRPIDALVSGSGNAASQDAINYGMTLAAMSQLARDQGMISSSAMVTAMMNDASDGIMDGRMAGSALMMGGIGSSAMMPATAGTSGLASAMAAFMVSAQNRSGVTAATMQQLMTKLNGSGGQMMGNDAAPGANSTLSGRVFNGAMSQATVTAYAVGNGARSGQLASTATDTQGAFALSLGSYTGPVMLEVTGGTFLDMASGQPMAMASGDVMTAVMPTIGSGAHLSDVWVTPLSSMAQARAQAMSGGMMDANITSANTAMGNYFMVGDVLHTPPMDPTVPGSGSVASPDQRNCGIAIAAMSQYAREQGMTGSWPFITSMMSDASDGMMDGRMGGNPVSMGGGMMGSGGTMQSNAATGGLAVAMTDFMTSAMNRSGLTAADMNALIQKLASSDGKL